MASNTIVLTQEPFSRQQQDVKNKALVKGDADRDSRIHPLPSISPRRTYAHQGYRKVRQQEDGRKQTPGVRSLAKE